MSQDTKDQLEKISPAEKARRLAREAKEKREREEGERQAQKAEKYSELKERLRAAGEVLAEKRQELKEVQEGLNEISDIEQEGLVTDDLTELRAQLEGSKAALEAKIAEDERAIQAMEADPLHVEMAAVESAAKAEDDRVQAAEQESLRKKEALEKIERAVTNLDTVIREISSAIKVAEKHEEDIRSLRAEKKKLEKERDELAKGIETDIGGLLYVLPEKQQKAISDAVAAAKEKGVTIYGSDVGYHENHIAYRPGATTMTEWFAAWREKVTPSFLPFVDKPLRALLAFQGNARLEKFRGLQGQLQELTDKENALFADRKETNIAYIERFLAPGSATSALDDASLQLLRLADGVDREAVREKFRKLSELRSKFIIVLTDLGDERYRRYENSRFRNLWLSPDV